jgi:AraC family transcriptional regulator, arabinose operon regulatory protein
MIIAGIQSQSREYARGFRPTGTRDWLLVTTLGGLGYVRVGFATWTLRRGDMLLFAPDTPQDYGYLDDDTDWLNIWVHVRPRPHWMPWLIWPQVAKGVMILPAADQFDGVEAALRKMVDAASLPTPLKHDLAMNHLERVLILCTDLNPAQGTPGMDPRIRRSLEVIGEKLAASLNIDQLSRAVGLSRSRFSVLFTAQTQMSPQSYVEFLRLTRAAQMLQMTGWPIGHIAREVGFADPYYFSTRFRRHFGIAPTVYRNQQRI